MDDSPDRNAGIHRRAALIKEERAKAAALKLRVMSDSWPSVTESEQFLLPWETGPLRDGSGDRPAFLSEVLSLKRVIGAIFVLTQLRRFKSRTDRRGRISTGVDRSDGTVHICRTPLL